MKLIISANGDRDFFIAVCPSICNITEKRISVKFSVYVENGTRDRYTFLDDPDFHLDTYFFLFEGDRAFVSNPTENVLMDCHEEKLDMVKITISNIFGIS